MSTEKTLKMEFGEAKYVYANSIKMMHNPCYIAKKLDLKFNYDINIFSVFRFTKVYLVLISRYIN